MYPREFVPVLRDLISNAGHPEITSVQTFEEAGYEHKPVGVMITTTDGVSYAVAMVGTSPPGGNASRDLA